MTRTEFASVMAYISTGVGKAATREQAEVYFDLLADLPLELVREGARRAMLEHRYASLPPVGLIRQNAITIACGRTTGPHAWQLLLAAVRRYGRDHEARGLLTLPDDVAAAARTFGWGIVCEAKNEELGIVQTQFLKVYETLSRRDERRALMPPMSAEAAALCGGIGTEKTDKALQSAGAK